jgi:hypothetical protein
LDIDFASCRAGSCAALSRDPRGHPYFFVFSFLFLFHRLQKCNRNLRGVTAQEVAPPTNVTKRKR